MTLRVLLNQNEISNERKKLVRKGVSSVDNSIRRFLRKFGLVQGMAVGDISKSWDVSSTVCFLEGYVKLNEPILDIGCYASELILALYKLGYTNLSGADLNPHVREMPYSGEIRYEVCDFMHTHFADSSFRAITSISVIEHGFDATSLLKELSRILMPGGYFIASFDYWPEKIDTTGMKYFGLDWMIFSKDDVCDFVAKAASYGLFPVGDMMFDGESRVIECGGINYTFAWLVLQKKV